MKSLILSDGKLEVKEIENSLEEMQKIVGGYIEIPFISNVFTENNIDIIINEDGKYIDELNPEIAIVDRNTMQIIDIIYGNCLFVSHDSTGETVELNEYQIKIVMELLKNETIIFDRNSDKDYFVKILFI